MASPTPDDVIQFIKDTHQNTVLAALDIRFVDFDPDAVALEVDVSERLFQNAGIVHGGVYVLLAESAASTAAALSVDVTRYRVAGQEINANHLRSVTEGTVRATARPVHRGSTSHVYAIDVTDQDGRLVCVSRCTIAVREIRGAGPAAG